MFTKKQIILGVQWQLFYVHRIAVGFVLQSNYVAEPLVLLKTKQTFTLGATLIKSLQHKAGKPAFQLPPAAILYNMVHLGLLPLHFPPSINH